MKNSLSTAITVSLGGISLSSLGATKTTQLESEDIQNLAKPTDPYDLHFLAVGDWGRNGADHQLAVAQQMGSWAEQHPNDFIISTGDNFYPSGVVSEHDPLWHYSFENIYTAFSLQWDWYPILGNHDYKSDPDAQVRYSSISRRWKMPSRYYSKSFSLKGGKKVLMAFIDTNPMIPEFYQNSEYGPHVAGQQPEKQLAWLDQLLSDSDAHWKIVIGHHPIYTAGPRTNNYDTLAVRKVLESILDRRGVDMYLSGHDHSLQHLKVEGKKFHQFISGAGSEVTPVKQDLPYGRFARDQYGFIYFSMNAAEINCQIIDHEGRKIYENSIQH